MAKTLTTPAVLVDASDVVLVDNVPVAAKEKTRVYRYYKPSGLVTSHADEKGRKTIFDALPPELQQVKTVGRLDLNSEGLLLLTNDGAVKRHLELPATGWARRYRVRAFGIVYPNQLENLRRGVTVEGVPLRPDRGRGRAAPGQQFLAAGNPDRRQKTAKSAACSIVSA